MYFILRSTVLTNYFLQDHLCFFYTFFAVLLSRDINENTDRFLLILLQAVSAISKVTSTIITGFYLKLAKNLMKKSAKKYKLQQLSKTYNDFHTGFSPAKCAMIGKSKNRRRAADGFKNYCWFFFIISMETYFNPNSHEVGHIGPTLF